MRTIEGQLSPQGAVSEHPYLNIASLHGDGFLTGTAEALVSNAVSNDAVLTSAEWEDEILGAAGMLILAVINRRLDESGGLGAPNIDLDPTPGSQQLCLPPPPWGITSCAGLNSLTRFD